MTINIDENKRIKKTCFTQKYLLQEKRKFFRFTYWKIVNYIYVNLLKEKHTEEDVIRFFNTLADVRKLRESIERILEKLDKKT